GRGLPLGGQAVPEPIGCCHRNRRQQVEWPAVLWPEGRTMSDKVFRCAIYTRKSSDEGLDQAFNSLDAQREAGEAYVRSQAHEGWTVLPDRYDDGGFSGGTMERPA